MPIACADCVYRYGPIDAERVLEHVAAVRWHSKVEVYQNALRPRESRSRSGRGVPGLDGRSSVRSYGAVADVQGRYLAYFLRVFAFPVGGAVLKGSTFKCEAVSAMGPAIKRYNPNVTVANLQIIQREDVGSIVPHRGVLVANCFARDENSRKKRSTAASR